MLLSDATPALPEWLTMLLSGNLSLGAALIFIWWKWIQPLIQTITERHLSFLDNIEKAQTKMLEIMSVGPQLHQITHLKIDAVHSDVRKLQILNNHTE